MMDICEIFESIQGEGRYVGMPTLFIRLSGCTRECDFCDSQYHKEGIEIGCKVIINKIKKSNLKTVVWTGGEPLLQLDKILDIIKLTSNVSHQIETNGDLIKNRIQLRKLIYNGSNHNQGSDFDYICISPKCKRVAKNISKWIKKENLQQLTDIKIVTDLKVNKELIPYATMLMPLTQLVCWDTLSKMTQQSVWNYCVKYNIRYSPRLHIDVWGRLHGK